MGNKIRKKRKKPVTKAAKATDVAADKTLQPRRAMRVVVIVFLFLASIYATGIPPGKGPDESAHLRYIEYLAANHRLPVFNSRAPGADYEFHQPPLYYLICLPTYLLTARNPQAAEQTLRFVNILICLALLYLTFKLGQTLVPDHPWAGTAAASAIALLPMQLSIAASLSNDPLTEVFFCAVVLLLVNYLRAASRMQAGESSRGFGSRTTEANPRPASRYRAIESSRRSGVAPAIAIGALIGLGLLTKSIAVLLFPVAFTALAFAAQSPEGYRWKQLARDLALIIGAALLVSGWWLARNQILYGDLLAQRAFLEAFQGSRPSPQDVMAKYQGRFPPGSHLAIYLQIVMLWTLASVVGVFGPVVGNRFVFFPYWVYLAAGLVALISLFGFVKYLIRIKLADWQRQAWMLGALLTLLLLVSFIRFNFSFFQAQARYLFPALPFLSIAFCLGIEMIAPERWRQAALAIPLIGLALLTIMGLPVWVLPQFNLP